MGTTQIGIRLADGRFYPVLEGEAPARKRMTLARVDDAQERVVVHLVRREDEGDADVGEIDIDDLRSWSAGELVLFLTREEDGSVTITAEDSEGNRSQSVSIDADSLSAPVESPAGTDDFGDDTAFDIKDDELGSESFSMDEDEYAPTEDESDTFAGIDDESDDLDFGGIDDLDDMPTNLSPPETDDYGSELGYPADEGSAGFADDYGRGADDDGDLESSGDDYDPESSGDDYDPESSGDDYEETGFAERRLSPLMSVAAVLLSIAGIGALTVLIYNLMKSPDVPPLEAALRSLTASLPFLPAIPVLRRARR